LFYCRSSSSYNNILSFAATGVDNSTLKGGFERNYKGDFSVTLHGRTYHYFPKSNSQSTGVFQPSGGMSYFTFDTPLAFKQLDEHAALMNRGGRHVSVQTEDVSVPRLFDCIDPNVLRTLYLCLREVNPYAKNLVGIGAASTRLLESLDYDIPDANLTQIVASLNENTAYLEVAR
jgi:hypothetical protein